MYAYRTSDPAALAAYRTAVEARKQFGARLRADAAAIGHNLGVLSAHRGFGGPEEIVGLEPDQTGKTPDGWRIVRGRLEPALRGKGSAAARRWLEDHQPPPDVDRRWVLKKHGLAYQSRIPAAGGTYKGYVPVLFEHDGYLWACYKGRPDGDFPGESSGLTWPACPLDEYETARIGAEHAAATGGDLTSRATAS